MNTKTEIHKRLGVTITRVDEITDELFNEFTKNRSLGETVEFVKLHYDSESVIAGIVLDAIIDQYGKP